ncbi:MAG: ATP-binding protein [Conexivisphaerales archaeon]
MEPRDIERCNEWWITGRVRRELALKSRRMPFSSALSLLDKRQITILTGLRRVGKTTILYQIIEELLKNQSEKNILYYSFEDKGERVKDVLEIYERNILRKPIYEAGKVYIFLDEVQYSPDWVSTVKRFYDLYPNIKFYLSGSSSLLLSKSALEALAGRFFFVEVYPLTFREFLQLRGINVKEPNSMLEPYFSDYMMKAGFPEIVKWNDSKLIRDYIVNSIIERIILRDIPSLFGRKDPLTLEKVISSLVSRPGSLVNLYTISKDFGISRITASRYLQHLETTMLIRSLANYRPSTSSSSRKLKKYYPATTSLIFALSEEKFQNDRGSVLETYVVNSLGAKNFYRRGNREIDALLMNGRTIAVEVKLGFSQRDAKMLFRLSREVNAERSVLVTESETGSANGVDIIPAYALEWSLAERRD